MGAYESRQQHSAEEAEPIADYYALLEVSEEATQDEIKKVGQSSILSIGTYSLTLSFPVVPEACFETSS